MLGLMSLYFVLCRYTRKGGVQYFMKEYDNAMETYQTGLKHDPDNEELKDGVKRCVEMINAANRGQVGAFHYVYMCALLDVYFLNIKDLFRLLR